MEFKYFFWFSESIICVFQFLLQIRNGILRLALSMLAEQNSSFCFAYFIFIQIKQINWKKVIPDGDFYMFEHYPRLAGHIRRLQSICQFG